MDTSTRNEVNKVITVAGAVAPGPIQALIGWIHVLQILLGWLSVTAEVFVRFSFGERYLSPLRLLLAWWAFKTYRTVYFFIGGLLGFTKNMSLYEWFFNSYDYSNLFNNETSSSFLYVLFVYGFWGFSIVHWLVIAKRKADGVPWHSNSFGISFLEFLPWEIWHWLVSFIPMSMLRQWLQVNDWKLYCILEPLLCYQAAQWLKTYDAFLGSWLVIASVTLAIKNTMLYLEMRGRQLDMMDAQIESHYLQAASSGADKRKTAGYSVVPMPTIANQQAMDIAATVEKTMQPQPSGEGVTNAARPETTPIIETAS